MSTAVAEPGTTASPLSAEEIARWTDAQALAAFGQLAAAMLKGKEERVIEVPPDETRWTSYRLLEIPRFTVRAMRPDEIDDELRALSLRAADPKNRLELTDERLERLMDLSGE